MARSTGPTSAAEPNAATGLTSVVPALVADHDRAPRPDLGEVAAHQEAHVGAPEGQSRPEIAADRARAHDADPGEECGHSDAAPYSTALSVSLTSSSHAAMQMSVLPGTTSRTGSMVFGSTTET